MNTINENQHDENELNSIYEQTFEYSEYYANRYIAQHQDTGDGLTAERVMTLASARLQWVLDSIRPKISRIFSADEITTLLDCNVDHLFMPDQFSSIPSMLCEHHGIELEVYESTSLNVLVNKLRDLDSMQFLALADALEQIWHRGMKDEQTPEDFLLTLGIELV